MKRPELSDTFVALWKQYGLPIEPVREFRFAPPRRWRFDVAWPECKIAVELEGGQWIKSRHRTGTGYGKDAAKYNAAVALGWRILRFVTNDLDLDPLGTIKQVADLLNQAAGEITCGPMARESEVA
jgi:very-short-patch-repair endonuclease